MAIVPKGAEGCRRPRRYRDKASRSFILTFFFAGALLTGCARFESKTISPAQSAEELESRSLTNVALKAFLEKNLHHEIADWPPPLWNFDMLTLAAFYYHPDLAVARAQWNTARAGIKTAGGRPNPSVSLVPGYDTTHGGAPSPWFPAVSFDVPVETAGKRARRIAIAEHATESARLNLATTAWQIRGNLRKAMLDSTVARQRVGLLQAQVSLQEQIVAALEQQVDAGAVARSELPAHRIALQKARLDFADAQSQSAEARARFAEALGIRLKALDDAEPAFDPLKDFTPAPALTAVELRRTALQSRSDILGALADYAAAEETLRLEIARQYPDVHFNPGYQFDQGDNKWSLGITFDLPILNQNQGPIAEAAARREEAAAKFNVVQSKALAEIERATEVFHIGEKNSATLSALADEQVKQRVAAEAQFKAGMVERLDWLNAQFESSNAGLLQLDAQAKFQAAAAALEDVVQRPLPLMNSSVIESPQPMKGSKP